MKLKTPQELESQLHRTEHFFGGQPLDESARADLLSLSIDELKERYPQQYQVYTSFLKTEAKLLHFPDIENRSEAERPKINLFPTRTRGYGFKITFSDGTRVIKPLESSIEKNIAQKASELGIGPKQFKSKKGYLHEEFIDGTPFLQIKKEKCTPEYMEELGRKFAKALKKLHENNILVNDQILADDYGNCHIIIDKNGEVRFIDFGASINLENFPAISDEAVVSLMRTDPFMAFRIASDPEGVEGEIKGYRDNILSRFKTKEDLIQAKDFQLLNEGLSFLASRLPNVESFFLGVKKELGY